MADLWLYTDPHYDHDAIRTYCDRPFKTTPEMNEVMHANYSELVKPNDDVIFMGDFAFRNHAKHLGRLPGKKTFIFGNHDKMSGDILRNFTKVVGGPKSPGILELRVGVFSLTCSHFPMASWNCSHYGSWHVHGHCHGRLPELPDMLRCDVGVDAWDFRPVNFELVKQKLEARIPAWEARQARMAKAFKDGTEPDSFGINKAEDNGLMEVWLEKFRQGKVNTLDYHTRYAAFNVAKVKSQELRDDRRTRSEPQPESDGTVDESGRDDTHAGLGR